MTSTLAPAFTVHRVTPEDAARMRALRLEMLADSPLAFLETLAQAAARPHADYRRRIVQASTGGQLAQFVADLSGVTRPLEPTPGHGALFPEPSTRRGTLSPDPSARRGTLPPDSSARRGTLPPE